MTEKQKRFCLEYLIDMNATQAAIRAGYSKKTARSVGNENLTKPDIKNYIEEQLQKIENEKIADVTEVMQTLTSNMRRENPEVVVVTQKTRHSSYDINGHKVTSENEIPVRVEIPTRIADVNKAAELLGKRYGLFTDKVNIEAVVPVFGGEEDLED